MHSHAKPFTSKTFIIGGMLHTQRLLQRKRSARRAASELYRRFEHLPAWLGVLLGGLIGAGLAALFLWDIGGPEGWLAYALLVCAALWLGLKGGWVLDLKLPDNPVALSEGVASGSREAQVLAVKGQKSEKPASLLDMVEIAGGSFLMGSARDDSLAYDPEFPQHRVTVSAFLMSRFPVTVREYRMVLKDIPSEWLDKQSDEQSPANYISWFQAIEFCNALSEREGLEPCYQIEGQSVRWRPNSQGYRLPTEAEWEYAARAGTQSRYFYGEDPAMVDEYAWNSGNSGARVHPVGLLKPNPFGLYDLLGNVWEWCWDWYGSYVEKVQRDPAGPDTGEFRVLRGGSAWSGARDLRSADRGRVSPVYGGRYDGFRCVRGPAASR